MFKWSEYQIKIQFLIALHQFSNFEVESRWLRDFVRRWAGWALPSSDNPFPTKEGRLCPPIWFVPTMFGELPTRLWIARKRGSWVSSGDQDDGKFECVIVIYSNAKHRYESKLTGRKNLGRTILQIDSESLIWVYYYEPPCTFLTTQ